MLAKTLNDYFLLLFHFLSKETIFILNYEIVILSKQNKASCTKISTAASVY